MFPHETSQFGKHVKVLIQNLFICWLGWKMYYKVKISGVFEHFWLVEKLPENQGLFFFLINSISDSVALTRDAKVIFTWFYLYNWISRIVVLQKWIWSFLRETVKREISEAFQTAEKIQTNLVKKSVKRHYQVKKLFLNIFWMFWEYVLGVQTLRISFSSNLYFQQKKILGIFSISVMKNFQYW